MVILDGRCLCVQKCCCLNLVVPLQKTSPRLTEKELTAGAMRMKMTGMTGMTKTLSTRSLSSEVTRIGSIRGESSSADSEQWTKDSFELTGWSLFRTRRFVAIPDGLLDEEEDDRKEDEVDNAEAKRQKLRRELSWTKKELATGDMPCLKDEDAARAQHLVISCAEETGHVG
eukprot:Skav221337  [mRNA]  locus=scaffold1234:194732:203599:+ [translate_table: standard]